MSDLCRAQGLTAIGILDQDYWNNTADIDTIPVIGNEYQFDWSDNYCYFIATNWIPSNDPIHQRNQAKRLKQINLLKQHNVQCINLIHPTAIVPDTCTLGQGIMIGANVIIGNHCAIGDYCQIREQSYLAHSSTLKNNVVLQVQSYTGTNVVVHENSYIGIKSSIIPKNSGQLTIPSNSFVKSHSLVTQSLI
jgi:UDP-3-O-[3-hydroxymyristoyl] glucosamine N-acyltransferase